MRDQILLYREMCDAEKVQTLQRGMNYRLNPDYSVILMSQRSNAPYTDRIHSDGLTIEYEGHDIPKTDHNIDPKSSDQSEKTRNGKLTQNGLFVRAVQNYKGGQSDPEVVRVYEKILPGIWSEKGFFNLIDYKYIQNGRRRVYRFILKATDVEFANNHLTQIRLRERNRLIPTEVKKKVWERDQGKCVLCGAKDELHFDHDLPYSKGGSSTKPENVKILCARHNLEKSDKIQ